MTTPIASIIIPIAPAHVAVAQRAIASAHAQTLPCEIIPVVDDELRGAGYARNRGIEQASAEFVVFLDADDWLLPNFVERCWSLHQQTGRYVFTDWTDQNGVRHNAPECAWVADAWHAVTAFIPTAWVRDIDGFDETLRLGGEDSEFYVHLCTEGHCGTRLPEALFVYTNSPDGRSKRWHHAPERQSYNQMIEERYVQKGKTAMACCTEPAHPMNSPDAPAPNKVLARPRWGLGNRRERGVVTGTLYPPADSSQVIEVDPRDAAARPRHWEVIVAPQPPKPLAPQAFVEVIPTPNLQALANRALHIKPPPPQPPTPPPPAEIAPSMPDVGKVTRLAQKAAIKSNNGGWYTDPSTGAEYVVPDAPPQSASIPTLNVPYYVPPQMARRLIEQREGRTGDPVFVFPDTDYPSYTDVRRLVELSGFEIVRMSEMDDQSDDVINIILSPEQPAARPHHSRQIWWTLEYGGEYEPRWFNGQDEVWASDPAWAQAHGAKLVVMGSHPRLADAIRELVVNTRKYDVLMLSYMTERRTRIDQLLNDLSTPAEPYPGYGIERHAQLVASKLMLHVHQRDDTHAIAPQRIALAAAYKLPLICERVPLAGVYEQYIPFVDYDNLNAEVRSQLAMYDAGVIQERGERLHRWLCEEHTFRMSVEQALKS